MIQADPMTLPHSGHGSVLCAGSNVSEADRNLFLQRNSIENLRECVRGESFLYDSIDFPFEHVEAVLQSPQRLDFLYILTNSPMNANVRVYDEFVFKNFPYTTRLLKQIRQGGDTFVFQKHNRDVLFVKFHNIYEASPLLRIALK